LIAFGLVWHIWWMVGAAALTAMAAIIGRGFVRDSEKVIPAREVERSYMRWLDVVAATRPVSRALETKTVNAGRAAHPLAEAAE
ncbi:MAG: cytochrome ubiquinol oxidase subunit I, partial [Pseudolabrys sp.]